MLNRNSDALAILNALKEKGVDLPNSTPKKTLLDVAADLGMVEKVAKAKLDQNATNEQIVAALAKHGVKVLPTIDRKLLIRIAGQNGLMDSGKSKISAKKKAEYGKDQNCGDEMAEVLKTYCEGNVVGSTIEIGHQNGIDVVAKYGHLNAGMMRMNLGNILRGRIKAGHKVVIGREIWNEDSDIPVAK